MTVGWRGRGAGRGGGERRRLKSAQLPEASGIPFKHPGCRVMSRAARQALPTTTHAASRLRAAPVAATTGLLI